MQTPLRFALDRRDALKRSLVDIQQASGACFALQKNR